MCLQVSLRHQCADPGVNTVEHTSFLGTYRCKNAPEGGGECSDLKYSNVSTHLFGGICLKCFHREYPDYFTAIKNENPTGYMELMGHSDLPMPDDFKRHHAIFSTVGQIYIAERIKNFILKGGTLNDQDLFSKDYHVIKDDDWDRPFEFSPMLESAEKSTRLGVSRWMEIFVLNRGEMEKAYEKLRVWRFESTPRDDIFEKEFRIPEFMDLKFPPQ